MRIAVGIICTAVLVSCIGLAFTCSRIDLEAANTVQSAIPVSVAEARKAGFTDLPDGTTDVKYFLYGAFQAYEVALIARMSLDSAQTYSPVYLHRLDNRPIA